MIKSYFRIARRHLVKNKMFTAINILGLSLAMAAGLLIYEYTGYEKSFDRFHEHVENIYRVTTVWNKRATPGDERATTVPWSGPGPKEEFSEIKDYTRFAPFSTFTGETWVSYHDKKFAEEKMFFADPGFLRIFSFRLVAGDQNTALSDRFNIVLTETSARRYFEDKNPIGKIISINTHGNFPQSEFKVTGVIQDPPVNSHIQFDFLVSYSSIWPELSNGSTYWHWDYTYCYLLLNVHADAKALERKVTELRAKLFSGEQEWNDAVDFKLQPLKDIHLFSALKGEPTMNGDGRSVYFLILVGACILLCAYANYVNLATVKAVERGTEIAIRKIAGSSKWNLTAQLLIESGLLNAVASLLAIALFLLLQPWLRHLTEVKSFHLSDTILSPPGLLWMGILLTAGIVLSSLYPVVILSSFKVAQVLKGGKPGLIKPGRINLRKSLMVVQFVFCIGLTVGTFALYRQLQYMKSADIGMNVNQVLVVKGFGNQPYASYENFKSKLETLPAITSVGTSSSAPGEEIINLSLRARVRGDTDKSTTDREVKVITIDAGFFNTLDVTFLGGRNFDPAVVADRNAVILNEAAAELLGFDKAGEAAGQNLVWGRSIIESGQKSPILGVIRNYHQLSLKNPHEPEVFITNIDHEWQWNKRYYFIRLENRPAGQGFQRVLSDVEKAWKGVVKDEPFNYFFLDQYFNRQYKSDSSFNLLFISFSALAIVVACLGLLGLVAFTTLQRTKEIGVRKVLGATVQNILTLLALDFIRLMFIAILLAVPFIAWALDRWLNRYAFRIELHWWLFAIPVSLIVVVALLTVVLESLKVALTNPAKSLRNE